MGFFYLQVSDDDDKLNKYLRGTATDLEVWSKYLTVITAIMSFCFSESWSPCFQALQDKKLKGQLAIREDLYGKSAKAAAKAEKVNILHADPVYMLFISMVYRHDNFFWFRSVAYAKWRRLFGGRRYREDMED